MVGCGGYVSGLRFGREELVAGHAYAGGPTAATYLLHGGFRADGTYAPPRSLVRTPAVERWSEQLREHGAPMIDVSEEVLGEEPFPNLAQYRLLLDNGLERALWDALTTTG